MLNYEIIRQNVELDKCAAKDCFIFQKNFYFFKCEWIQYFSLVSSHLFGFFFVHVIRIPFNVLQWYFYLFE